MRNLRKEGGYVPNDKENKKGNKETMKKEELLTKINEMLEILPENECLRIYYYLLELYF